MTFDHWLVVPATRFNLTGQSITQLNSRSWTRNGSLVINFCVGSVRQNGAYRLQLATAKFLELGQTEDDAMTGGAVAPMPGVVDKVVVSPGDIVKAGDPVAVIIAMKMEVCLLCWWFYQLKVCLLCWWFYELCVFVLPWFDAVGWATGRASWPVKMFCHNSSQEFTFGQGCARGIDNSSQGEIETETKAFRARDRDKAKAYRLRWDRAKALLRLKTALRPRRQERSHIPGNYGQMCQLNKQMNVCMYVSVIRCLNSMSTYFLSHFTCSLLIPSLPLIKQRQRYCMYVCM